LGLDPEEGALVPRADSDWRKGMARGSGPYASAAGEEGRGFLLRASGGMHGMDSATPREEAGVVTARPCPLRTRAGGGGR